MKKVKSIVQGINSLDNMEDLNTVIASLKAKQKSLRDQLIASKKAQFKVGDTCICNTKKGAKKATITDIRRRWATIDINGTSYNAPLSILGVA